MPDFQWIYCNLALIAKEYAYIAPIQHGLLLAIAIAWAFLKERIDYVIRLYLVLLLAGVSLSAWLNSNVFNGVVFAVLALAGIYELLARKMDFSLRGRSKFNIIIALIGALAGFYYPHFVDSYLSALWASPMGFIPCPTLLVVLAFFLLAMPRTNKLWHWMTIVAGLAYSIVGIVYLKVYIDYFLLGFSLYSLNVVVLTKPKPC